MLSMNVLAKEEVALSSPILIFSEIREIENSFSNYTDLITEGLKIFINSFVSAVICIYILNKIFLPAFRSKAASICQESKIYINHKFNHYAISSLIYKYE